MDFRNALAFCVEVRGSFSLTSCTTFMNGTHIFVFWSFSVSLAPLTQFNAWPVVPLLGIRLIVCVNVTEA